MSDLESILSKNDVVDATSTAHVMTAAPLGFTGSIVDIECDTSNGLPGITLVGMGNKAIDEAKERIRSAINNSNLQMPKKRITLNLAPADLPKVGSSYDVPLALAILVASKQISETSLKDTLAVGELALDGRLRGTRAGISFAEIARRNGFRRLIMPRAGSEQAAMVEGVEVIAVDTLRELYRYLNDGLLLKPARSSHVEQTRSTLVDMHDVSGQRLAKRALEIAAAGGHNILMYGPPGTGKTLLAKALVSILPAMTLSETIVTTKLHSLAGEVIDEVVRQRPFRTPHHSTSHVALVGGGRQASPGEISLAHNGVLFLDEIPEFGRQALESLRQPLEDGIVTVSRAEQTARYPAEFMLVATRNPCPCGYYGDQKKACTCTSNAINAYQNRLSGPLMDRIDMRVAVERVAHSKLLKPVYGDAESSQEILQRVQAARQRQQRRFGVINSRLSPAQLKKVVLSAQAHTLLNEAAAKLELSPRSYMRIIKVSRSIADLVGSNTIQPEHVAEALQYRG